MGKKSTNSIQAIRSEYKRIDSKWLNLQFWALLYLMLFAAAAEIGMFFILKSIDLMEINPGQYALRYLAAPSFADLALLLAAYFTLKSEKASDRRKIYTLSLVISLCCFVLYTVHSMFHALYLIFAVPMILTVIYANRRLTGVTALVSTAGKVLSDLFITWDSDKMPPFQDKLSTINFFLSLLILGILYFICHLMILIEQEKNNVSIRLEQERQHFQEEALTDPLTRLWNRKALRETFRQMEEYPVDRSLLAMLDMDDFKILNDTYGHTRGDQYLRELGAVLKDAESEDISAFRFGGDEFCILFCNATRESVEEDCRKIQKDFAETAANRGRMSATLSIGVAGFRKGERPAQLLERADAALYRAKQQKGGIDFSEVS